MTGFRKKTSTLKEYLSLLSLPWQPTTAQLNPLHIFIFSYIEKVSTFGLGMGQHMTVATLTFQRIPWHSYCFPYSN